ncbi:hypothetical protein WA577_006185, partial [Blastocystis sp. JDR]
TSEWIIGPFALCYAAVLFVGSYVGGYAKLDFAWAVLRYNRILCNGEVWRFFTPLFCMGYPVYRNLYHIVLLCTQLRHFEYHPYMVSATSHPTVNFLVEVLYAILAFWITCLFYPLYYAPCFIILTLISIQLLQDRTSRTELLGLSVKSWHLPFIYVLFNYFIDGTIVCEVFPVMWGWLFLSLAKKDGWFKRALLAVMKQLESLLGLKQISFVSREEMRERNLRRFREE